MVKKGFYLISFMYEGTDCPFFFLPVIHHSFVFMSSTENSFKIFQVLIYLFKES